MNSEGIVITTNLPGRLGAPLKHVTKQVFTVRLLSPAGKVETLTRKILHTNREPLLASRKTIISSSVVSSWERGECPAWAKSQVWRKLNSKQRIAAYVETFNEGFGVSYE